MLHFYGLIHFTYMNILTIVNFSAGVGRSGTFIALDYLLDQAEAEKMVDVQKCTSVMRKNRMNMVQNLVRTVLVYIYCVIQMNT